MCKPQFYKTYIKMKVYALSALCLDSRVVYLMYVSL